MTPATSTAHSPLPPFVLDSVRAVRARFEAAWSSGAAPRLEDFLTAVAEPARPHLLRELVAADLSCRLKAGEAPQEKEYLARFPDLDPDWLRAALESLGPASTLVQHAKPQLEVPASTADVAVKQLGKFLLLEKVGQGAFGAVWRARDTELDRLVALKVPHAGLLAHAEDKERFYREARAAAQLRHPGIVPVHEVATLDGVPALVADYIEGLTLRELLQVRRLDGRAAAELVAQVADALDYAHGMGLVHRDVKPANILVEFPPGQGLGATPRPLVTDFGLALRADEEVTLTLEGQILGTPAYMSPEQAAGRGHDVDRRSDVYSLGVLLYELLTGELPFRGSKAMVLHQVLREEPRPPRRVNDAVPRDLETVCLKALAKAPGQRYPTARALADDLRRYLNGEPVHARPVGSVERLVRWCRREPRLATLTGTVAGLLLAVAVGSSVAVVLVNGARLDTEKSFKAEEKERIRAVGAEEKEKAERRRAEEALEKVAVNVYYDNVRLALNELTRSRIPQGRARLDACPEKLRGWEWHYLNRLAQAPVLTLQRPDAAGQCVAYTPDGKLLISAGQDGLVCLWDAETGQEVAVLRDLNRKTYVDSIAVRPDGRHFVTGTTEKIAYIWGVNERKFIGWLYGHTGRVWAVAYSPDGKRIATGSEDRTVRVWDADRSRELLRLEGFEGDVRGVAFTPDGRRLVSVEYRPPLPVVNRQVPKLEQNYVNLRLWDLETKSAVYAKSVCALGSYCLALSPDGRFLVTGGINSAVRLIDTATGEVARTLTNPVLDIRGVAFSADGKRLAVGTGQFGGTQGDRSEVLVWDLETGWEDLRLSGHAQDVAGVAFSPDGRRLATGSQDQVIKVWELAPRRGAAALHSLLPETKSFALSPDGRSLVLTSGDLLKKQPAEIRVLDAATGQRRWGVSRDTDYFRGSSYSADGTTLAVGGSDGAYLFDARDGKELATFRRRKTPVLHTALGPDGKLLVASELLGGEVVFWDRETRAVLRAFATGHRLIDALALSPDGKLLATGSRDKLVKVWDVATGQELHTLRSHTDHVSCLAFDQDGKRLASGSFDRSVRIWDPHAGTELHALFGHEDNVTALAFSPDGRRLASNGWSRKIHLWDTVTGREALDLARERGTPLGVDIAFSVGLAFSPDGHRIYSAHQMGSVLTWEGTP